MILSPFPISLAAQALPRIRRTIRSFVVFALFAYVRIEAQTFSIEAPAAGVVEAGVPTFTVLGADALGLSSTPLDLQPLPDGTLFALGRGEFAIGDGSRWEVYRQAESDPTVELQSTAVDENGRIYGGMAGGFGRIDLDSTGHWHWSLVSQLPENAPDRHVVLSAVSVAGDDWLWSLGSGPVFRWRPGQRAEYLGDVNAPEKPFAIGPRTYVSDSSNGDLFEVVAGRLTPVPLPPQSYVEQAITSAAPFDSSALLVGTIRHGVQIYRNGHSIPLAENGPLSGTFRVNDLCATDGGMYAAALDNFGILFFDRTGHAVQALERTIDHRFGRVRRLLRAPGGVIWALLGDGIARIAFPSRVSDFEPLVASGLSFAQPYRFQGTLWLIADGRAQHAVYGRDQRLTGFEINSPDPYVCSMTEIDGRWIAGTRRGIYAFDTDSQRWTLVVAGPVSPYFRRQPVEPGRWLYLAENETGWLDADGGHLSVERFPEPTLGHSYGATPDSHGIVWSELGMGRVARVEPTLPRPTVRVFGRDAGLSDGWVQLFMTDSGPRAGVGGRISRFDSIRSCFVPDPDWMQRPGAGETILGRPAWDSHGRLWLTRGGHVDIFQADGSLGERLPEGIVPTHFTPQPDGVVWLHQRSHLKRYDSAIPAADALPLRAMITHVEFPASGRNIFNVGKNLPPLEADDNHLVAHFLAPNSPPGEPVVFDVILQGADSGWIPTGSAGAATFNHLHEGSYQLCVRPRVGTITGQEASVAFVVRPPWFRTTVAYVSYGAAGIGLLVFVAGTASYLSRREKRRLELLVGVRTRALHESNRELAAQMKQSTEKAEALRVSEDRYRRLTENAPDIVFRVRVHPEPAYDYVNSAVERISGYSPAEFYRDPHLPKKLSRSSNTTDILDIAASGRVSHDVREISWTTRDGREITLEERISPVHDRDGRLVAIEGIARDITERKNAEEEIRRLSHAIEQSPVGVLISDLEGRVVFANPRMTEITGFSTAELIGRRICEPSTELVPAELTEEIWTTLTQGEPWHGQLATQHKDGRVVHLRSSFSPLRGPGGAIRNYLALQEDISSWLDDQERQRKLERQLFQSQKLESLGTLAGGIAHDFNNILTGILGFTELVSMSVPDDPAIHGDLAEIRSAGLRAKDLVGQILAFSRRADSRLAVIDLGKVTGEAMKLVRASTPSTIEIVRELESATICGDATQIHQIVLNLCTNAVHAMRDAPGRLTVTVARVEVDAALATRVSGLSVGPQVLLSVHDTGEGMSSEKLARIFDPFFTTKSPGEGTGLGLSIVKGIADSHRAILRVESAPNCGTSFAIYFPPATGPVAELSPRVAPARSDAKQVMVVDDEPSVARFTSTRLQQLGYRVTTFTDSRLALAAFIAAPERFDAIVTDLTMPHLTGIEMLAQMRAGRSVVPAVVMSGRANELASISPDSVPRVVRLSKPFTGDELAQALGDTLRSS